MTAQKNQIQALIAEIDGILGKASPNLPWVMSRDAAEQRQLLGRIRGYLLSLQKAGPDPVAFSAGTPQNLGGYDIHASAPAYSTGPAGSVQQEAAQQILQAVVQEMGYLRANLTQPLQADIEALRQQREVLVQEVRQLEAQRQQYGLLQQQVNQQQMLNEFLQVLMGRLQENLAQQITQSLASLNAQALPSGTIPGLEGAYSAALNAGYAADQVSPSGTPLLSPAQRLDHLQSLQAQSDHLLISLDSSLSVVFEALQRNIQSYQDSLSQGIEKMHSLGYQGEVMFTALVNHLAQQLGREASSFLQSATQPTSLNPTAAPLPPITPTVENVAGGTGTTNPASASGPGRVADRMSFKLPYPGSELPLPTSALDIRQKASLGPDSTSLKDLDLEDLDLSDLNLNEPDLTLLDSPNLDTLLDLELNAPSLVADAPAAQQGQSSNSEVQPTVLEIAELPLLDNAAEMTNLASLGVPSESTVLQEDEPIDTAALEFLEQLSAALEEVPAPTGLDSGEPEPSGAQAETGPPVVDDRIYEELDDFYATLFGEESGDANAAAAPEQTVLQSDVPEIVAASIGEEEATELVERSAASSPPELQAETSELPGPIQAEEPSLEDFFFAAEEPQPVESVTAMEVVDSAGENDELPLDLTSLFGESDQSISPSAEVGAVDPEVLVEPSDPLAPPVEDVSLEDFFFGAEDTPVGTTSASTESPGVDAAAGFDELPLDLTVLFGETESPQPPVPAVNVVRDDTLELLSSLLSDDAPVTPKGPTAPSMQAVSARVLPAPDGELSGAGSGEDSYIPAAPDENLLAADRQTDESELDLSLNPSTLQRLSEDLSSLEGLENLNFQDLQMAFSSSMEPNVPPGAPPLPQLGDPVSPGWDNLTLNDFADALPALSEDAPQNLVDPVGLPPEVSAAVVPESQGLTLEHIDDLFGDLPSVPPTSVEMSGEAPGGTETSDSPTGEAPMTLDDVFGDFFGSESESDQKKKVP